MVGIVLIALAMSIAPDPDTGPEIVVRGRQKEILVLGRKLADWRGQTHLLHGRITCRTQQTTGDRQLDKLGCTVMRICVPPQEARLLAISREPDETLRHDHVEAVNREIEACATDERSRRIAKLVDERAAAER
ncbi:hypothetical protein [Sphingomonas nostoxanthinifaciens]|uniref:hypothetical protein n=1 Tax=Sphingomonas nostoxanthinifaciens TaxID=2872652 RepID=UPI001CC1F02D|nr:hypothetical protein [Sphingomonas nostoxanthinifaciens]UAK24097.1 hypothetical protein K8P63_17440 [Sphingomonas nostoxanthinifaciens]